MIGGGSTKEVSSATTDQHPNGVIIINGDTGNKCLLIDIHDDKSGEKYCTFSMSSSDNLQKVYDALIKRRGGEDSFILKLGERRVFRMDTPNSLGMSDHVELTCSHSEKIVVRNFWTREKVCVHLESNDSFHLFHRLCVKMSGNDWFDLPVNSRRLKLLGMKNHVELVNTVPVIKIFIKDAKHPGTKHEFLVRRDQKLRELYRKYRDVRRGGSFFFMYGRRKLSLDVTPESLRMKDQVEIFCNASSSVIFDVINVETKKVEWTMTLETSSSFRHIRRPTSDFYLDFNGSRIGYDDTPLSLGIEGGDWVALSYTPIPIPVVEIDLCKLDGEFKMGESKSTFMLKFRLKPHQPLRTIYNAYSEMSFQLVFEEDKIVFVSPEDTPESLGMKSSQRVELLLVPIVIIGIYSVTNQKIVTFDLGRTTPFRNLHESCKEIESLYERLYGSSSFDFYFKGSIIDLNKDTPETLGMKDRAKVKCVPTSNKKTPEKKGCICINCNRKRKAAARILGLGLDEADDAVACCSEECIMKITINIAFIDKSSASNEVVLRSGYNVEMKTLFSRYAAVREIPLKSLRFKHGDRMLFVSSIGSKSLYDLGMRNRDIVYVSRLGNVEVKHGKAATAKKSGPSQGVQAKKGTAKGGKKKAMTQPSYSTMDEEERLRRAHSKKLTIIFDEASPQFKKIRQKLNNLALEQTPPKVKSSSPRARATEPTAVDLSSFSLDNKAIKTRFNILVGEVSNLYKSTKLSKKTETQQVSITIDLHGYTKEAAITKLDASLPSWVDAAMHGNYPFVIPVTIICGAGGQVLSEVVEQWIRENERVANARKNMFI